MQIDEAKGCTQRAMLKYGLSPEEGNKYQQFLKLLATFDASIDCYSENRLDGAISAGEHPHRKGLFAAGTM